MSTISLPRRRRWLSVVIVGVFVAILLFTALAGFVVEVLWYNEIHQSPVFWHTLWTKIWLGVVFGLLFFALLYVNLVIARRIRPERMPRAHASSSAGLLGRLVKIRRRLGVSPAALAPYGPVIET